MPNTFFSSAPGAGSGRRLDGIRGSSNGLKSVGSHGGQNAPTEARGKFQQALRSALPPGESARGRSRRSPTKGARQHDQAERTVQDRGAADENRRAASDHGQDGVDDLNAAETSAAASLAVTPWPELSPANLVGEDEALATGGGDGEQGSSQAAMAADVLLSLEEAGFWPAPSGELIGDEAGVDQSSAGDLPQPHVQQAAVPAADQDSFKAIGQGEVQSDEVLRDIARPDADGFLPGQVAGSNQQGANPTGGSRAQGYAAVKATASAAKNQPVQVTANAPAAAAGSQGSEVGSEAGWAAPSTSTGTVPGTEANSWNNPLPAQEQPSPASTLPGRWEGAYRLHSHQKGQALRVHLSPTGLGPIEVALRQQRTGLGLRIHAQRLATAQLLDSNLDQLTSLVRWRHEGNVAASVRHSGGHDGDLTAGSQEREAMLASDGGDQGQQAQNFFAFRHRGSPAQAATAGPAKTAGVAASTVNDCAGDRQPVAAGRLDTLI